MKKLLLTFTLILGITAQSFAHYLWIETKGTGVIGEAQNVKVHYGEYTYGEIEQVNGEAFPKVKNFTLWLVDAKGNKTKLETTAFEDHYLATFTPKTNGTYTLVLDNNDIEVLDYSQYNFGIFKTHYHATTKVQVGNNATETASINHDGIVVKDISKNADEVQLQVLFKNKPLAKNELKVFVADLWSKTLETDEQGIVSFKLPWNTKYIIETTTKEEVPGTFKGKDYEFIWHCATFTIL